MENLRENPPGITLDAFVLMPNHIHGIIFINESDVEATGGSPIRRGPRQRSLGLFLNGFKSATTKRINDLQRTGLSVWQRNYYEHVIRDEDSLRRIREYIVNNPARWDFDRENPAARTPEVKTRGADENCCVQELGDHWSPPTGAKIDGGYK